VEVEVDAEAEAEGLEADLCEAVAGRLRDREAAPSAPVKALREPMAPSAARETEQKGLLMGSGRAGSTAERAGVVVAWCGV
jgi:hypothetical protein